MDSSVKAAVVMALVFVLTQLGAMLLIASALGPEYAAFEDPNDPMIPIYYITAIVLFTFAILYIIKKRRENIVRVVFLGAVIFTIWYVLFAIAAATGIALVAIVVPLVLAGVMGYALVKWPEWYVIDSAGVVVAIGVVGIFGMSLNILPVLIMLIVLAAYDAISVYGTKHMVALADGVTSMRLPILLVIPKVDRYSYLEQRPLKEELDEGSEREAMFMGLGDLIIPGVLVASAFSFLPEDLVAGVPGNFLVALGALAGGLLGFAALMRYVLKGNPQAGLPLLNGGVIAGYMISYILVFEDLSMGITLPW